MNQNGEGRVAINAGPRPPVLVQKGKEALERADAEVKEIDDALRSTRTALRNAASGSVEQKQLSRERDEGQEQLNMAQQRKMPTPNPQNLKARNPKPNRLTRTQRGGNVRPRNKPAPTKPSTSGKGSGAT